MRLSATKLGSIANSRSFGDQLFDLAGEVPNLDLNFAGTKTLDPRVTFTRASTGTFVGSDGLLQSAVTNLVLRSEEFDNASWTKSNSTVTANAITAPNGTLTADKLITNNAASSGRVSVSVTAAVTGSPATLSCFAKQGETSVLGLFISDGVTGRAADFDLITGTVSGTPTAGMTASIEAVGDGWYRCIATVASITGTTRSLRIVQTVVANDGIKGLYIWGAQFEETSTVGEYIPTTSVINSAPRFDHNPTTGESLGLLVEEARTNSLTNNTMVGAVAGTPGTLPTGWPFQASSNGLAVSIVGTGTESGIAYLDWRISGTATAAAVGDICFGRASALTAQTWTGSSYLRLVAGNLSGVTGATIGLIEETVAPTFITGALYSISLPTTASLITQRPAASRTLTGGVTVALLRTNLTFNVSSGSTVDFTIRIGLPQVEQGAFATSVIPTTTATATRAADVARITGSAFSSWYRQDEGTLFCEYNRPASVTSLRSIAAVSDGGFNNRTTLRTDSSTSLVVFTLDGSVLQTSFSLAAASGANNKAAAAYKLNNCNAAANGLIGVDDTSATVPVVNQLSIGSVLSAEISCSYIRRITFWPVRLANITLQAITAS